MKLAQIDHSRCGEWRATTYVWVADDMGTDELGKLVEEARVNYLIAIDTCKANPAKPPYTGHEPNYRSYPSTVTLAEAQEDHARKKAAYTAWEEQERAAQKNICGPLGRCSRRAHQAVLGWGTGAEDSDCLGAPSRGPHRLQRSRSLA
jgi:hypothetical protein